MFLIRFSQVLSRFGHFRRIIRRNSVAQSPWTLGVSEQLSGERYGGLVPVWSPSSSTYSDPFADEDSGIGNGSSYSQRHPQSHQLISLRRLYQTGHLESSPMDSVNQFIDVLPTSGAPNSVFHHVVQAPEDHIHGVSAEVEQIKKEMGADIDVTLDCVGLSKTMSTALGATSSSGKVCLVGMGTLR